MEDPGAGFRVGVQWHPEVDRPDPVGPQWHPEVDRDPRLFEALVDAAGG